MTEEQVISDLRSAVASLNEAIKKATEMNLVVAIKQGSSNPFSSLSALMDKSVSITITKTL